jgi:hypothetical protein
MNALIKPTLLISLMAMTNIAFADAPLAVLHSQGHSFPITKSVNVSPINVPTFKGSPFVAPYSPGKDTHGQLLGSPVLVASFTPSDLANYLNNLGLGNVLLVSGNPQNAIKIYSFQYVTVGGKGEATTASGAIMVPQMKVKSPLPIVLYSHGTAITKGYNLANYTDPTNEAALESAAIAAMFAAQGFVTIASNYAGYDTSTLSYHPYHNAQQQSGDMLDALSAARRALLNLHYSYGETGEVFLA